MAPFTPQPVPAPATVAVIRRRVRGPHHGGVCLAHLGHQVTAVDVDPGKIERLLRGESPILEEGLPDLIRAGLAAGRLRFTTEGVEAATGADFVFLCVPTPQGADGAADLRFVEEAAAEIAPI